MDISKTSFDATKTSTIFLKVPVRIAYHVKYFEKICLKPKNYHEGLLQTRNELFRYRTRK